MEIFKWEKWKETSNGLAIGMTGDYGQKSIHPRFIYFLTYPARSSKEFGIGFECLKFLEGSISTELMTIARTTVAEAIAFVTVFH